MSICNENCDCHKQMKELKSPKEITIEFGNFSFTIGKFSSFLPEFGTDDEIYFDWLFFYISYIKL